MKQIRILAAVLFILPMMAPAQAGSGYAFTDLGAFSRVAAINNAGQVLGYSYTADLSEVHATISSGTSATDLGTLGGTTSFGQGINNAGQVVGYSYVTGDTTNHATLWNGTSITDLNDLPDPAMVSNGWVLVERMASTIAARSSVMRKIA